MKHRKDRLQRVIIIGATPSGVAAAGRLVKLGIQVILIDSAFDLDHKLSHEKWNLKSGLPLNYAYRPRMIRTIRSKSFKCILPAEILSIKHNSQGFRARIKKLQTFIDPEKCILCGRCVEACPAFLPEDGKAITLNSRRSLPGGPVIDKRQMPPCRSNCPLGVNVQGYIALAKTEKFAEALSIIRENNVLPGICGRICTHPCETDCRRSELDEPIAIRDIKRFVADYEISDTEKITPEPDRKKKEKIAVIGSGPSGLAAAADIARSGYPVTVFEKEKMAGGLLRYGIGIHRLPREILDRELNFIEQLGVKFVTSHPINMEEDLEQLKREYKSVILATGAWEDRKIGAPGEDMDGVEGCMSFLIRFYRNEIKKLKEKVVVIGDGNAAFDLARVLSRIGADVTLLSWFSEDLIPADPEEIKAAREEGVLIRGSAQVIEFKGRENRLDMLCCKPTKPGKPDAQGICWPVIIPKSKPFELKFDRAIVAIGQTGQLKNSRNKKRIQSSQQGYIKVDDTSCTNLEGVYASGDIVTGPSSVVDAMAMGIKVARLVHSKISNQEEMPEETKHPDNGDFLSIPTNLPSLARPAMPERRIANRVNNFEEVAMGLSKPQVLFEAERCLQCGVCSECLQCMEACGEIGAINHSQSSEEIFEQAGVVIIADPKMAPNIKGSDVIRAYGPKTAKADSNSMLLHGFASAARAMTLLGSAPQLTKGHGVSFSLPDPGLSDNIRIGVFVCKCNDSAGWLEGMDEHVEQLTTYKDVVHAEIISSACIPEGTSNILRTIRDKGLTRLALASCVCCPLDFVCSSCTDQRSRLKDALFMGTGISRSMIETCNLRGEALSFVGHDDFVAMSQFRGLIDRSIKRAKRLRPFPALARNYNFTTAVIGEAEATVNSATTLANAGLDVFLFGTSDTPLAEEIDHPNIHSFKGSSVKSLKGTLGDFQVLVESSGFTQSIQVGAVILGEKSRKTIPYIHQEGLPGHIVKSAIQEKGIPGVPFFDPGSTFISGLYLADPPGINISNRKKGAAAAVLAATDMPRGPRQGSGYKTLINEDLCRGCGRCVDTCPYRAISYQKNTIDGWCAQVDEVLCKGCGNCISVCPSNAADSPFRDQAFLEQVLEEQLRSNI